MVLVNRITREENSELFPRQVEQLQSACARVDRQIRNMDTDMPVMTRSSLEDFSAEIRSLAEMLRNARSTAGAPMTKAVQSTVVQARPKRAETLPAQKKPVALEPPQGLKGWSSFDCGFSDIAYSGEDFATTPR